MTFRKKLSLILLLASFATPTKSQAVILSDTNYEHQRLEQNQVCSNRENCFQTKSILLNPNATKGLQANYKTEKELATLLTILYATKTELDLETQNNLQNQKTDGIMYYLSTGNYKQDGSLQTIFDTTKLCDETLKPMPKKMKLHHSIQDLQENSPGYKMLITEYGKNNTFIQAIDVINHKNAGLYNWQGELVESYKKPKILIHE